MEKMFEVKEVPSKIVFGDPLYFEEFENNKKRLKELISNISITAAQKKSFVCYVSVSSETVHDDDLDMDFDENRMKICIAPKEHVLVYLGGEYYTSQNVKQKEIGVDSASYFISVDKNYDTIKTGGDGYWGTEFTYTRNINGKKYLDAILLDISFPDDNSFDDLEGYVKYFFNDVELLK